MCWFLSLLWPCIQYFLLSNVLLLDICFFLCSCMTILRNDVHDASTSFNCKEKNRCPLEGNCLVKNIVYMATVKTETNTLSYVTTSKLGTTTTYTFSSINAKETKPNYPSIYGNLSVKTCVTSRVTRPIASGRPVQFLSYVSLVTWSWSLVRRQVYLSF